MQLTNSHLMKWYGDGTVSLDLPIRLGLRRTQGENGEWKPVSTTKIQFLHFDTKTVHMPHICLKWHQLDLPQIGGDSGEKVVKMSWKQLEQNLPSTFDIVLLLLLLLLDIPLKGKETWYFSNPRVPELDSVFPTAIREANAQSAGGKRSSNFITCNYLTRIGLWPSR
ncbi:hypothetical protein R5R35_011764 [Gryllus longicercus]|uniref:Uncharacterized protein n=1 Tax=Gryllus longicercus TaxID=2509291 RepID=A0AAN9VXM2_9ORTH